MKRAVERKQDPYICCLQETHLRTKDRHRLKVKGWKKFHTKGNEKKKVEVATYITQNRL